MAEWTRSKLGKQAKELGFVRDTYEKVCRLTQVLKFFEEDELLHSSLALKGGTAINLIIFNLPRLSVDIDLDFSKNVPRDDMMESRSMINDRIAKYMTANGYVLSTKSRYHHALDSFVFEYVNSGGVKDNIKIEINYMLRCHLLELPRKSFRYIWEPSGISILCVDPLEIFASKIIALLNRTAPRDLYDIHNLVTSDFIKQTDLILLRKSVVFYSAIGSEAPPIEFQISNIDRVTQHRIKTDLFPVMRNKEFDLQTSQLQVKNWLEALLDLERNEQQFLEAFRAKEYRPDLLFEADEIVERIRNHPMAIWKCSQK